MQPDPQILSEVTLWHPLSLKCAELHVFIFLCTRQKGKVRDGERDVISAGLHTFSGQTNLFQLKPAPALFTAQGAAELHRITSSFERVQNSWLWCLREQAPSGTTSVGPVREREMRGWSSGGGRAYKVPLLIWLQRSKRETRAG